MRNKKIQSDILSLLKKLVSIDTSYPPGDSDKFDRFIREYLKGSKLNISSYFDKDKKKEAWQQKQNRSKPKKNKSCRKR